MGYSETFHEILGTEDYQSFKENYVEIAQALDGLVTATIDETQLEGLPSNTSVEETRRVMGIYDELGVISSKEKRKTVPGEGRTEVTEYRIPDRHGKGFSTSWQEVTERLESAMQKAEREKCWEEFEEIKREE